MEEQDNDDSIQVGYPKNQIKLKVDKEWNMAAMIE